MAGNPTFSLVYQCLQHHGPAQVTSSRGTNYEVHAEHRENERVIVGYPRSGQVVIHEDCWGSDVTCQGTRAGGIFNGSRSIYDWYRESVAKTRSLEP